MKSTLFALEFAPERPKFSGAACLRRPGLGVALFVPSVERNLPPISGACAACGGRVGRRPFRAFGCGDFAGLAGGGGPRWPVAVLVWVKLLQIFFATPEMLISFEGEKKNPTLEKLI